MNNLECDNSVCTNNSLMNIYFYDSYLKNSLTKLEILGGHTNLTGQNGAGKTSALNLIPIFYGARPDKLVDRSANKLNFTDYYLPNDRSLLIYEYVTPTGVKSAVFYRHPMQGNLCTRFIQGEAESTLLLEENLQFHAENNSAKELFAHLYKQGLNVSVQIENNLDYRAIITNDKNRLKINPKLRDLATLFSLSGPKVESKHIGALTQITSNKLNLLDSFKQMLIDLYLDSERSVTRFKINNDFTNVTNELRVLYKLQKEKPKIQMGIEKRVMLLKTYQELMSYKQQMGSWKQQNEYQVNQIESKKHEVNLRFAQDSQELKNNLFANGTEISSIKGQLSGSRENLARIERTEAAYKQNNVLKKQQEFNQLSLHKQNIDDAKQYVSDLEQKHQEITQKFSQLKLEVHEQKNRDMERNNNALADLAQAKEALNDKQQSQIDQLIQLKEQEQQTFNFNHERERSSYETKITKCSMRIETVTKLEDAEQQEKSAYCIEIDLKKSAIQNKEIEIAQHYSNQNTLRDEFERIREDLRLANTRLNQLQQEKINLNELIGSNNTILHFLNQTTDSHWRDSIAKVINPKLLSRTDLNPFWDLNADDHTSSFFGLNLDLSRLETPNEADSLDIQVARLNEIESSLADANEAVTRLDLEFSKSRKKRNDAETYSFQINTELRSLKSDLDSLQIEYQSFNERIAQAIQLRKVEAEKFLQLTQKQFDDFKVKMDQARQSIHQRFLNEKQRIYDATHHEKNILLETQSGLDRQNQKIKADFEHKLNDLKMLYENELQQRGFDVQVQRDATQRYETLRDAYERIKGYQNELIKYSQWVEGEYKNKGQLVEQLASLEKQAYQLGLVKQKLTDKLESIKALSHHELTKLQTTINKLEAENRKLTSLLMMLENIFADVDCQDNIKTIEVPKPVNFEMLCRHVEDLCSRRTSQYKELKSSVQVIMGIIRQNTNLELYKLWKSRMDEHGTLIGVAYDLQGMHEIEEMLYQDIPSREGLIRAQFCLKAYSLRDYAEAVLNFNNKLNKVSKELNYKTNNTNPFPALTEIHTQLVSVLDGLSVYEQLKSYVRDLQEFDLHDSSMLPSEHLIESYERTYTALESAKVDTNDIQTLVRLRISYKENGREVIVNNDSDLAQGSSTGLSRLIIIIIFTALTRDMCADLNTAIHMPLDEIGQFDAQNTSRLFQLMQDQNINLLCAQPNLTLELSKRFTHKHDIDRNFGIRKFVMQKTAQDNPLLDRVVLKNLTEIRG